MDEKSCLQLAEYIAIWCVWVKNLRRYSKIGTYQVVIIGTTRVDNVQKVARMMPRAW